LRINQQCSLANKASRSRSKGDKKTNVRRIISISGGDSLKRYISVSGGEQKIGNASGGTLQKIISISGGDSLKRYISVLGGEQKIGSASGEILQKVISILSYPKWDWMHRT
jgi:hypothetical protein